MKGRGEDEMQLETFFPYRLAIAAEAFSRNLVAVYGQTYGLSREEWRLLFLLQGAGQVTSLDLSRRTTLDKVQVSRAAQRLEDKGLITREVSVGDRRLKDYTITPAGRALFAEAFAAVEARAGDILGRMKDRDRQALERGLAALAAAVAEAAPDGLRLPEA